MTIVESFLNCVAVSDGRRYGARLEVFEFDGNRWEEAQKLGLRDELQGHRAIAVDLATSGFDEFCA